MIMSQLAVMEATILETYDIKESHDSELCYLRR